jgi:hypothetical protein
MDIFDLVTIGYVALTLYAMLQCNTRAAVLSVAGWVLAVSTLTAMNYSGALGLLVGPLWLVVQILTAKEFAGPQDHTWTVY